MTRKWRLILIVSLLGNLTIGYVGYKGWEYRSHINVFLNKYNRVMNELSGRSVYAESNQALVSDSIVPGRVVFLGTQVTENWNLSEHFPEYDAINRGLSHQRVAGFLLRFQPDVLALGPEALVIEVSSYNFRPSHTLEEIEDYVVTLVELATYHGIKPILTTVIPPTERLEIEEHPDYSVLDSVAVFNQHLVYYARAQAVVLVDLATEVSDADGFLRQELATTRVDLNDSGYTVISNLIREELNRLLSGSE